jgi:hypothetical protein
MHIDPSLAFGHLLNTIEYTSGDHKHKHFPGREPKLQTWRWSASDAGTRKTGVPSAGFTQFGDVYYIERRKRLENQH